MMAEKPYPYKFEGEEFRTALYTYDSMAAWYINRHATALALTGSLRALAELEAEIARFPARDVRLGNPAVRPEDGSPPWGTAVCC